MSESNGFLSVDQMLAKAERPTDTVPFRGGRLKIRSLMETEKVEQYESWFYNAKTELIESRKKHLRTRMIALCVYHDDPEIPCLPPDAHKTILDNWTAGEVAAVFDKISEMNGTDPDEVERDLEKN